MAAVASGSAVDSNNGPEKERNLGHSPSRFTAVNEKDTSTSGGSAPIARPDNTPNSDRQVDTQNCERRESTIPVGQGEGDTGSEIDRDDRLPSSKPSLHSALHTNKSKRKRSQSYELQRSQRPYQNTTAPQSPVSHPDESLDLQAQSTTPVIPNEDEHPKNPPAPCHSHADGNGDSRTSSTSGPWHEYDAQLVNQAQCAQQIDASDAQLVEALQRDVHSHNTIQKNWGTVNRRADGSTMGDQLPSLSAYAQEPPQTTAQVAPKRKRVFSNRTKTGCMTCRRRKKKCDEQHPACNNCIRGGFICEGYSSRSTWQKPSSAKIPLQSKDGFPDVGNQYVHGISQQHDRQPNTAEQPEPGKMRPTIVDDSDRTAVQYNTSPTGVNSSRGSWPKRNWSGGGHSSYVSEHIAKSEHREVPSIHELSREGPPKSDYQVVPPIRELSHGGHPKPGMTLFQGGVDQRPIHSTSMDTGSPRAQARMALSIEHQLSNHAVPNEETEKEKMIHGELYRPFDAQLVEERERCKAALWRFNNACNPISGLSAKEQNRLLKEVFVPSNPVAGSPSAVESPRAGSIGQGVVVEAPFSCHYGYNIHIGEDVMISANCLFVDDCGVSVGAHTWIGPNVTILSSMAHANMQERKGSQSRYQGRPVTIEEDCFVGAGCTIYPGVRLRRGAYVAPGEVVKSDIVAYGFQGLKPNYM